MFRRDGRFAAVVAAQVNHRVRLGSSDDLCTRDAAAGTNDARCRWTFSHENLVILLDFRFERKDSGQPQSSKKLCHITGNRRLEAEQATIYRVLEGQLVRVQRLPRKVYRP